MDRCIGMAGALAVTALPAQATVPGPNGKPKVTTAPVGFAVQAWSHDALFGDQDVRVAFSDFRASAHEIHC